MTTNLLLTKLYRPTVPAKIVPRPYLSKRLDEGLQYGRQLTLVSAPAGFGKTTVISAWAEELDRPLTWLTLDEADDDPGRFFTYFVAALQKVDDNLGSEIDPVLRAGQLPPTEIISATLINDILKSERPFVFVLDDFQAIQDETILQVLRTLVTNLPPPLHLVLLTREEPSLPLARLRANNQMTEIRAADLRFAREETAVFLNEVMGLSLKQTDIAALAEKTEGWVVGLQLAGLSMRDRTNPSEFIADLSGSHRHILSYLLEEVLNQQPDEIQDFLLKTSILDKLTGALCDAVIGGKNGRFLLEQLYNDNLFLIPLDDEQQWYRYHQLFADLLRDRQKAWHGQETAVLHQRASQWFVQAGMSSEAIRHALDAADYETAVSLIEAHAMDLLMAWHAKTVKEWMQRIPTEWAAKSPKTNLTFAWMHLMRGNYQLAMPYLERLQMMLSGPQLDENDPAVRAEWLALQATLLNGQGIPEQSIALADEALTIVPQDDDYVRTLIYGSMASAYIQKNDRDRAVAAYEQLIQHGRLTGSLVAELMGISALALFMMGRGELHDAFEIASQGVARVERTGTLPPMSAAVYGELGSVYYDWFQLEAAHRNFARSTQVSSLSGYSDAEIYHHVIRSRLAEIEGDWDTAVEEINTAVKIMQNDPPAAVPEEVTGQRIRIYLAQNDLTAAEVLLQPHGFQFQPQLDIPEIAADKVLDRAACIHYLSALRILLYRGDLQHGLQVAAQLIHSARQSQYLPVVLEALLLRAKMHLANGDEQAAQADVIEALTLAEPENFISVFLEEGEPVAQLLASLEQLGAAQGVFRQKILTFFPEQVWDSGKLTADTAVAQSDLIEPLSKRELEILLLIDEGCTNQEIADRLVITLHTVKKHSSNIYTKLGVRSRTQAIARARELELL